MSTELPKHGIGHGMTLRSLATMEPAVLKSVLDIVDATTLESYESAAQDYLDKTVAKEKLDEEIIKNRDLVTALLKIIKNSKKLES